jgi:hypothetical protein
MPITNVENGNIIGYKYFGFGGLEKDKNGLKSFAGTRPGNKTALNLFITPRTKSAFKINLWLDGPWANNTWKGKKIGEINVPANSSQETAKFTADVSSFVDGLDKKHAIFLVVEGAEPGGLCDIIGLGFSSDKKKIVHKERKRLSALGISGSAVIPKIVAKAEDDDFVSVLEEFRHKLAEPDSV